jgi:hypothetical protein
MILGQYSVGDLADLINAKTYDINRLQSLWNTVGDSWKAVDGSAASDWQSDWDGFLVRWNTAYGNAAPELKNAADNPSVPTAIIPANDSYLAMLHALKQVDGVITKGDYDDLWQRLNDANGKVGNAGDFSNWNTPQPVNADADIDIIKLSNEIIGSPSEEKNLEKIIEKDLLIAGAIGIGALAAYGLLLRQLSKVGL